MYIPANTLIAPTAILAITTENSPLAHIESPARNETRFVSPYIFPPMTPTNIFETTEQPPLPHIQHPPPNDTPFISPYIFTPMTPTNIFAITDQTTKTNSKNGNGIPAPTLIVVPK